MKPNKLEKELDARFVEIGFPNYGDNTIPPALREQLAFIVARFYNGEVLIVDHRAGSSRFFTKKNFKLEGLTFPKKPTLG
jgi:hypothetical protein